MDAHDPDRGQLARLADRAARTAHPTAPNGLQPPGRAPGGRLLDARASGRTGRFPRPRGARGEFARLYIERAAARGARGDGLASPCDGGDRRRRVRLRQRGSARLREPRCGPTAGSIGGIDAGEAGDLDRTRRPARRPVSSRRGPRVPGRGQPLGGPDQRFPAGREATPAPRALGFEPGAPRRRAKSVAKADPGPGPRDQQLAGPDSLDRSEPLLQSGRGGRADANIFAGLDARRRAAGASAGPGGHLRPLRGARSVPLFIRSAGAPPIAEAGRPGRGRVDRTRRGSRDPPADRGSGRAAHPDPSGR